MVSNATGYVDIDHWLTHDGGEPITDDEPIGDAMIWRAGASNPPGWPSARPTRCPCKPCTAKREATT